MPKFAANLGFLFTEFQFMERFSAARKVGFDTVEFMFPYDYKLDEIGLQLEENNLKIALFNLPAGNWSGGERGIATDPARKDEFRDGVAKAILAAKKFGVSRINCLVGKGVPGHTDGAIWETIKENVCYAADCLKDYNINLMIEPINRYDMPDFYLNRTEQVFKLLSEIKRTNVFLQYDIYHAEREQEDHDHILQKYMPLIGHLQIADNPGRHQPGSGNLNLKYLLKRIDQLGFKGYVGLEYNPNPDTLASLSWVQEYGYRLPFADK
jgi:hydroxypyruvate isomerase